MTCCFCMNEIANGEYDSCMFIEGREYRICSVCGEQMSLLYDGTAEQRQSAAEQLRRICVTADCAAAVKHRLAGMIREALAEEENTESLRGIFQEGKA